MVEGKFAEMKPGERMLADLSIRGGPDLESVLAGEYSASYEWLVKFKDFCRGSGGFTVVYMVGDKLLDLECGWNVGVKKSILVRTGYGVEVEAKNATTLTNALVAEDTVAAADWILAQEAGRVG